MAEKYEAPPLGFIGLVRPDNSFHLYDPLIDRSQHVALVMRGGQRVLIEVKSGERISIRRRSEEE